MSCRRYSIDKIEGNDGYERARKETVVTCFEVTMKNFLEEASPLVTSHNQENPTNGKAHSDHHTKRGYTKRKRRKRKKQLSINTLRLNN
jgi:hypothetical protein